jgi:hypothetical protein
MEDTIELTNAIEQRRPKGLRILNTVLGIAIIGYGAIVARDYAVGYYEDFKHKIVLEELRSIEGYELTIGKSASVRKLSLDRASYEQAKMMLLQTVTEKEQCVGKLENIKGIIQFGY